VLTGFGKRSSSAWQATGTHTLVTCAPSSFPKPVIPQLRGVRILIMLIFVMVPSGVWPYLGWHRSVRPPPPMNRDLRPLLGKGRGTHACRRAAHEGRRYMANRYARWPGVPTACEDAGRYLLRPFQGRVNCRRPRVRGRCPGLFWFSPSGWGLLHLRTSDTTSSHTCPTYTTGTRRDSRPSEVDRQDRRRATHRYAVI